MIILTILAVAAIALAIFTVTTLIVGGGAFVVVFGDLAVFILIIVWIIRRIIKK